jgi:hypothetical protein
MTKQRTVTNIITCYINVYELHLVAEDLTYMKSAI